MLSKILSKEECAQCKFCCAFRRCSAWETPLFEKDKINGLMDKYGKFDIRDVDDAPDSCTLELRGLYKTDSEDEEAPCHFLDADKGCILNDDEKPFDCKIWPLRVMKKSDGDIVIALTPTCPAINKLPVSIVKNLVNEELRDIIMEEAERNPNMIKEYVDGFEVMWKMRK